MAVDPLHQLRELCLSLPEAEERETWETQTFRVRDKIFAMVHHDGDRIALQCKAPRGAQEALIQSEPERYYVPAYVGHNGWIGMWLDEGMDWRDVAAHLEESYRMTAPKRLAAQMEAPLASQVRNPL